MRILKYESFLETMQFAALTNAQRLAKQEEERRRSKREEEDSKKNIPVEDKDDSKHPDYHDVQMEGEEGQTQMEGEEGQTQMEENYEEPEGQGEPEEAQGEADFRKIMVPGTNWNLEQFEKKLGQPITQYELSKDGKEVTEINGRPIADVVKEEFPEDEI